MAMGLSAPSGTLPPMRLLMPNTLYGSDSKSGELVCSVLILWLAYEMPVPP